MSNTSGPEFKKANPDQHGESAGAIPPTRNINRRGFLKVAGLATAGAVIGAAFGRPGKAMAESEAGPSSTAPAEMPDAAPELQGYTRQHKWVINQIGPGQKERFKQETDEADRFLAGIEEKIARINNPKLSEAAAVFKDENQKNRLNPDETPALVRELRLRDSSMPDSGDQSPFRYSLVANDQVGGDGGALFVTYVDIGKTRRPEFGPGFVNDVLEFYIAAIQHEGVMGEVKQMFANGATYEEITAAKSGIYSKTAAEAIKSYRELMPKIIPALDGLGLKFKTTVRPVITHVSPS